MKRKKKNKELGHQRRVDEPDRQEKKTKLGGRRKGERGEQAQQEVIFYATGRCHEGGILGRSGENCFSKLCFEKTGNLGGTATVRKFVHTDDWANPPRLRMGRD